MTDTHTYIRTWRLYDQPGPEGQIGEKPNKVAHTDRQTHTHRDGHRDLET